MANDSSAVSETRLTLPSRLAFKVLPLALMTYAVVLWISWVIGAGRVQAVVITFGWVVASSHELLTARPQHRFQHFRWSFDHTVRALVGQIVWLGLPWLHSNYPDAWFCAPIAVSPTLMATGAALAVCWPLYLFLDRQRRRQESPCRTEFAAAVLYSSFFLVSGHLVFAAIAYVASALVVADLVKRARWSLRRVPAVVSLCPEPHRVL